MGGNDRNHAAGTEQEAAPVRLGNGIGGLLMDPGMVPEHYRVLADAAA